MRYKARAPLRIDFGGGWTDADLYAHEHGGTALTAAITRYASGWIAKPSGSGLLRSLRSDRSSVSYSVDVPPHSGLGASAAQTVLWVTLVKTTVANVSDRREIASIACRVADLLGIVDGRQDEYASALGGITYLAFGETVEAERLNLPPSTIDELRSRLVLVNSGTGSPPAPLRERVWANYRRGDPRVVAALAELRQLATTMKDSLLAHDLNGFGRLLAENWSNQKKLDASVSNGRLDQIVEVAGRNGALGGKVCGPGGGGYLIFLAAEGQGDRLRSAFERERLECMDFDFDTYGVHLDKA